MTPTSNIEWPFEDGGRAPLSLALAERLVPVVHGSVGGVAAGPGRPEADGAGGAEGHGERLERQRKVDLLVLAAA